MKNSAIIIEEILKIIKSNGVRWFNGKDFTAKGNTIHCNLAIDLNEERLQIDIEEDKFRMFMPDELFNSIKRNPVLRNLYSTKDGLEIAFILYEKVGCSYLTIGKKENRLFGRSKDVTIDTVNIFGYTAPSSHFAHSTDAEELQCIKEVITFFRELFKKENFYKELELTPEKIRMGLSKIKNL